MLIRILQVILAIGALGLLVFIHEFGHFITSKLFKIKVLEFMLGLPGPKIFSFKRGETEYGVTAIPFGGYVKTVGSDPYEEITDEEKKRSLEHSPFFKKSAVVLAGPFMNFFFALLIMIIVFRIMGVAIPLNENIVSKTIKNYPAAKAGIKAGDKIVKVNGKPTKNWDDLIKEIKSRPNKKLILVINHKSNIKTVTLKTKSVQSNGIIGIYPKIKLKYSLLESTKESFRSFWDVISKTTAVIFDAVTGKPHQLISSGRGVVGIVSETSHLITSLLSYFMIIALLNIAIGFVNILPIPPLDGGKIFVYIVELIKGGYLSKKTLIAINAIGIALLLSVFVYFTINDISRIIMAVY